MTLVKIFTMNDRRESRWQLGEKVRRTGILSTRHVEETRERDRFASAQVIDETNCERESAVQNAMR
jgi:hypothetical protein